MKSLFGNPKRIVLIVITLFIVFGTLAASDGQAATRVVQLFYFLPNDQTYDAENVDIMKRWIVEIQSFYRGQMEAHGHGPKTFQIETDAHGDPIVHRVDGAHDSNHYANAPRPYEFDEIREKFEYNQTVFLVYSDLTVRPKFGGKGVGIKQRGSAVMYQLQWGTVAHELGHAFGLHHDFRDDVYIMSYGDNSHSLSKCAADFLALTPYFNPDIPITSADAPSIQISDSPDYSKDALNNPAPVPDINLGTYQYGKETLRLRIRAKDPDGLHQVFLLVETQPGHGSAGHYEVVDCRSLSGETDTVVEFTYDGSIPSARQLPTNLLNRIKHYVYISAVDKQGNRINHPIEIILRPLNIKQAKVPVSQRSPRVRDTIFNHLRIVHDRHIASYEDITDAHLEMITNAIVNNIRTSDSPLKSNDFDGLTNLYSLELRFESGYSDRTLLPAGIFKGLTSLEDLHIKYYTHTYGDDPTLYPHLPLTIGLQKVGAGKFKAVVPTGAPYDMDVPLIVVNGSITGGATRVKIPAGSTESETLTVTRTAGTTAAVIVDLERVVQVTSGSGYAFYKSSFPLELLSPIAGAPTAVSERTPQVIEAIVGEVPEINHIHHNVDLTYVINGTFVDKKYNTAPHVSEAHLAAITRLNVTGNRGFFFSGLASNWFSTHGNLTALKSGDFDGFGNLTSLNLSGNELRSLPTGIFDKLTNLTSLSLLKNELSSLPTGIFDKLVNLETLNLSGNALSSLPAGLFDKLTNLTYLNLLDNPLRSLPDGYFDKLTKLETLFLPPTIKQPSLPGLGTITPVASRTPQVRDAIVAAIPGVNSAADATAAHLAAIRGLDMREHNITALKTGDFDDLINLGALIINAPQLTSLPDGIFDPLSRLKALMINAPQLTSLPDGIFDNIVDLRMVYIIDSESFPFPDDSLEEDFNDDLSNTPLAVQITGTQLSSLPDGIFDNFTNVPFILLNDNQLHSLPDGIFDNAAMVVLLHNNKLSSLPDGIFRGIFTKAPDLTGSEFLGVPLGQVPDHLIDEVGEYTTLYLTGNTVDPLPLTISLKRVGNGQFKAVAPAGAPFKLVLPLTVANGSISGGASSITIPVGGVESNTFTVTRTPGTTFAVTVDIGTLPGLPQNHTGYTLVKSHELPLAFTEYGGVTGVSARTPAVRDAIVRRVPGVNSAADVTEAHLAAITDLQVTLRNGVKVGDFDGLTGLTEFVFTERQLTSIPAGLFKDLSSVTELIFRSAKLTTLPDGLFDAFTNVTSLSLAMFELTSLPEGIFDPFTQVTECEIYIPKLTSLPDGLFSGLTSLTLFSLHLNTVGPLPLTVSLKKVADGQFKAVAPTGAPFDIVLPLTVTNGSISGGATSITIAKGTVESGTLTITRTPGTTAAVTVNIGTLPGIPADHSGYELVKSTTGLPITLTPAVINNPPVFTDGTTTIRSIAENTASGKHIGTAITATDADNDTLTYTLGGIDAAAFGIDATNGHLKTKAALDYETKSSYSVTVNVSDGNDGSDSITVTINVTDVNEIPIIPVSARTLEVQNAIVNAIPNVSGTANVTAAHLAAITDLNLRSAGITALKTEDFSGMTGLTSLNLFNNQLSSLPDGIFEGLTSLTTVRLGRNAIDPLPFVVSLEKVGNGQFKAVAPAGALFNIVLHITVTNGSVAGGVTTVTIPQGSRVSDTLTVTRTAGTTAHVTVDIEAFPSLPHNHYGYALVKSGNMPMVLFRGTNTAPVFTDGSSTTRSIAENTAAGTNIGAPISATDADNDTLTYTLSGTNATSFGLDTSTGQLQTRAALDYETKTSYSVTVFISDGNGGSASITVTINVTDVNEMPTNTAPVFTEGSTATRSVRENTDTGQHIGTAVAATDADGNTLVYTLGGTDAASFGIDSTTGELKTKASLDYETKNVYTVTVTVSDGTLTDTITVTINVTDIDESPNKPNEASYDHIEGPWLWMIAPGGNIDIDNLSQASDGVITETQIAQNGVNEGDHFNDLQWTSGLLLPTTVCGIFLCSSDNVINVVRNIGLTNSDQLSSYSAYALINISSPRDQNSVLMGVGSDDSIKVWLNGSVVYINDMTRRTTGIQNQFYVNLNAGNNLLLVKVCNHGTLIVNNDWGMFLKLYLDTQDYTISLPMRNTAAQQSPTNTAPVFTSGTSTTRSIAENTASGQRIGTAITATDADNDTLTYTLGGTDAAAFGIDATTGQLKTKAALDYETKTLYSVTVSVSDGNGGTDSITVTINVTDVSELLTSTAICKVGDILKPGQSCTYPDTDAVFSALTNGKSQWNIPNLPTWLQWINQTSVGNSMSISTTINGVSYHFKAKAVSNNSWEIEEIGDDRSQQPVTPDPGDTGSTPTLSTSTTSTLTEATLHEGVVSLNLSGGTFERSTYTIRNAITVSGISGLTFDIFSVDRESDTEVTLELEFGGNMTTNGTFTISLGADAIKDYNGAALTSQISVSSVTESITASTTASLTEATLDESEVTITLSGRKFERSYFDIRDAVSVSGITGVTIPWHDPDRESDTELSLELEFDGDMTSDGTLTFTVGADAIAGYNGPDLTAQVSVSAVTESITASTTAPLTEATLDESVVTLTLRGRKFAKYNSWIRPAVSVTGISGVTVGSFDIDRQSDTEVTVELTYDGNMNSDGTLTFTVGAGAIAGYNGSALTAQVSVSADAETPVVTEPETPQQPQQPQQPGNTGGTLTLTTSTTSTLTEATLHEGVVSLNLSGGTFERSTYTIRNAITVSGISGLTFDIFSVDRESDTQATIELEYEGNMTANGTLTISLGAGAIKDYDGAALTSQISVSAVTESITASTTAPLTEATLDESVVTLTLSGRKFERWQSTIRPAVSITGISGVTVRSFDIDRESDTEVTVELTYDGNMTSDGTLTFTVGAGAIAGYNGPALTAQVSVSAGTETPVVTEPETPQQPQQPQQPGNTGGTPTLSLSTASSLTEATLHGAVVSLNLSGGTFEGAFWDLDDEISVSGITGVSYDDFFDVDRISDTKVDIELSFDSNMTSSGTLTFTVESDAIVDYDGTDLTAQISVSAVTESITATTTAALTEGNIDGSEVTITLSGRKFERSSFDIRDAFSVSGITGVTIPWHDPDRESDTVLTLELEFDGDMTSDGTLTFTVGADAIAGYSGPSLTAQLSVTAAGAIGLFANYPNPFNPETWFPYQLSKPSDVTITIYDIRGRVVRVLKLGHQAAGTYRSRSKAAYWDGKNKFGESVASGVYFYRLTAGDFSATRKMLIRK